MTEKQILSYLNNNPDSFCWLTFGVGMVRLAKGEGRILLSCMLSSRDNPQWSGPRRVTIEEVNDRRKAVYFHYE